MKRIKNYNGYLEISELIVAITLVIMTLFIIISSSVFYISTPTNGSHTGYVTAVEKNGIIWKTGRVYVKTDTQSSQEDKYCVKDQVIYDELVKAQTNKEKVTLKFSSPRSFHFCSIYFTASLALHCIRAGFAIT